MSARKLLDKFLLCRAFVQPRSVNDCFVFICYEDFKAGLASEALTHPFCNSNSEDLSQWLSIQAKKCHFLIPLLSGR